MSGPPCSVRLALSAMSENERILLDRALKHPEIRKSDLARTLRAAGHNVSAWMLRHHSRGDCSCR